jgi:hypothetical protein
MAKKTKKDSRRGQGMTEYVLLVAVVVGILFVFKDKISGGIAKLSGTVFDGADSTASGLMKKQ